MFKKILCISIFVLMCIFTSIAFSQEQQEQESPMRILQPTVDSEQLEEVGIIDLPNESGRKIRVKAIVKENESGGYEIKINEDGYYTAIKEDLPESIRQEILQNKKTINSEVTSTKYPADIVAYVETHEPLEWKLCSTHLNLKWSFYSQTGEALTWTWDAFPSQIDTHWYTKRSKNYAVRTDQWYIFSHGWAWHQNKDFGLNSLATNVYHDVFLTGYLWRCLNDPVLHALIGSQIEYTGEAWQLLHTHLYFYWIAQGFE